MASGMIFKLMPLVLPPTTMFAQRMIESESSEGTLLTQWEDMVLEYSITCNLELTHARVYHMTLLTHQTLTGQILQ